MGSPQVSKEALKAIANLSGLNVDEGALDDLLAQMQSASKSMERLDALDLKDVEPAIVFSPLVE